MADLGQTIQEGRDARLTFFSSLFIRAINTSLPKRPTVRWPKKSSKDESGFFMSFFVGLKNFGPHPDATTRAHLPFQ
ncbi:MAG: hypothetical protein ABSH48_10475 [Verrucomicrobiota bacterium]|jgi:hypothetical protein